MPKYKVTGYFVEESYERYTIEVEADNPQQAIDLVFYHGAGDEYHHSKNLGVMSSEPVNVEEWEAKKT